MRKSKHQRRRHDAERHDARAMRAVLGPDGEQRERQHAEHRLFPDTRLQRNGKTAQPRQWSGEGRARRVAASAAASVSPTSTAVINPTNTTAPMDCSRKVAADVAVS